VQIRKEILLRIYITFFVLSLFGAAILFQAFRIQVIEGDRWKAMADSLTTSFRTVPADRGNIFSSDGRLLATSLPFFDIRMDALTPAIDDELFFSKVDSLALLMARKFGDKDRLYYKNKLLKARKEGNRYLLLKRNVSYPDLQEIKTWPLFRRGRYRGGLIVIHKNKRVLPFGLLANRSIGYVRHTAGASSVGLEAAFNEYLQGREGKQLMRKVAGGSWVPISNENEIEPQNGKDIITGIDVNMQDIAEDALHRALIKHDADHGCVILMEVETGEIKAIANLGRRGEGIYWEDYNYAIGEAKEPGSTFKLATVMALMEDGYIDLDDSVDIGYGTTVFFDRVMRDAEPHKQGKVTVRYAFEVSSNVGISKLAQLYYGDQPGKYIGRLKQFHLDQKTGIELAGEARPFIRQPGDKGFSLVSVPWMSVGYEVMLSPLQMLTFYNAVANNGKMMKPYLVKSIAEYGKIVKSFRPKVIDPSIAGKKTIRKARELLEGVVEHGTARRVKSRYFKIAGKTGTAQIAQGRSGYSKVYQASFAGYFPAGHPRYSCIVVINGPSKGIYYGGSVAGPVFKELAEKVHALTLEKEESTSENETWINAATYSPKGFQEDFIAVYDKIDMYYEPVDGEIWVDATLKKDSILFQSEEVRAGIVPDVRGMGLRDALYLLENRGLQVDFEGQGKVVWQSVRAGTPLGPGGYSSIKLKLN